MNTRDVTGFLHEWMTRILSRKSRKKRHSRPVRAFFSEKSTKNTTCHSHENRCLPGWISDLFNFFAKNAQKNQSPRRYLSIKFFCRAQNRYISGGTFAIFCEKLMQKIKVPGGTLRFDPFPPPEKNINIPEHARKLNTKKQWAFSHDIAARGGDNRVSEHKKEPAASGMINMISPPEAADWAEQNQQLFLQSIFREADGGYTITIYISIFILLGCCVPLGRKNVA